MTEEKTGDCFEVAAQIVSVYTLHPEPPDLCHGAKIGLKVMEFLDIPADELALVHGMVTRPTDQLRHAHAWIEWRPKALVLDFSNGHQHIIPRELYQRAGQILQYRMYTQAEARLEMVDSAHHGPWAEEFTDG